MKRILSTLFLAGAITAALAGMAPKADAHTSISLGFFAEPTPAPVVYPAPAPVYYGAPARVVVAPQPVYYPPRPVYYARPQPVVYRPWNWGYWHYDHGRHGWR